MVSTCLLGQFTSFISGTPGASPSLHNHKKMYISQFMHYNTVNAGGWYGLIINAPARS